MSLEKITFRKSVNVLAALSVALCVGLVDAKPSWARVQSLALGTCADLAPGATFEIALEIEREAIKDLRIAERVPTGNGQFKLAEAKARALDFSKSEINLIPELPIQFLTLKRSKGFDVKAGGKFELHYMRAPGAEPTAIAFEIVRAPRSPDFVLMHQGKKVRSIAVKTSSALGTPYGIEQMSVQTY